MYIYIIHIRKLIPYINDIIAIFNIEHFSEDG